MSELQSDKVYKTLHPDYKIVGYDGTSRVYSGNPSLSQIPKILRYAVIPHDGNKFLYTDLKAAEVYVLVRWSKCTPLVHTYETGGDLYTHIAKVVLGKESITPEERDTIKVVVLSILYGSTGYSASRTLHITEEEAKGMVDVFFRAFPEIAEFQAKAYKYVQEHEYIQSFYFRPRILKADLTGDDSARKRQCVNSAIQNTMSDALKICIGSNRDPIPKFVTTVFDSVLFEVPKDYTEEQAKFFLIEFFRPCYPFKFNFEYGMGDTWGEAQENLHL